MADKWNTNIHEDHCLADGCYRETDRGGEYCGRHKQNLVRYGDTKGKDFSYVKNGDWVSDNAGPECRICGRSVYDHAVTEFCQLEERKVAA